MKSIFVSHTHSDKTIADALAMFIGDLFNEKVVTNYSSSKELDGGIAPGADWLGWIVSQVQSAELAFVVLTPSSIQKPWVLWEAGAVAGAAYARQTPKDERRVCPITFGVKSAQIPSPFTHQQIVNGTDEAEVTKLARDLFQRFKSELSDEDKVEFGERRPHAVRQFLEAIGARLRSLPLSITEASIQEWLERLEALEREGRHAEVAVLDDWINIAFGRNESGTVRAIDVRLHRRMGELYARGGRPVEAAKQLELARELSPRDIYLMRKLGKAYLDGQNTGAASGTVDQIAMLDSSAFVRNAENAAFKARFLEMIGDDLSALEVLEAAYKANPKSYYLGDRLGQLYLRKGNLEKSGNVYRQVLESLAGIDERSVWMHATAINACLVVGNETMLKTHLDLLRALQPTREQQTSIHRGLTTVARAVGVDETMVRI